MKLTKMPETTAQNLTFARYKAEINNQDLRHVADLMLKWKFVKEAPNVDSLTGAAA